MVETRSSRRKTTNMDNSDANNNTLIEDEKQPLITPTSSKAANTESNRSTLSSFLLLLLVFVLSLVYLYGIYLQFPQLDADERRHIKLPRDLSDAKELGRVLRKYSQQHYWSVLAAFFSAYVFLQTFAIPGSIFLSILSGFLYPFPMALALVCTCSSLGASLCFALSFIAARRVVQKYLTARLLSWQAQVNHHRDNLFYYITFLRITPFVPNWFINLASPLIGIPLVPFVTGTFVGVAPPSCFYIQAGSTLQTLASTTEVFSTQSILTLTFFSVISLSPVLFQSYLKKKIE